MRAFLFFCLLSYSAISFSKVVPFRIVPQADFLEARIDLIRNARSRILIAQYIFNTDSVGETILAELIRAKREQNLDIRIIIDGIGPGVTLPFDDQMFSSLEKNGIQVRIFNPKIYLNRLRNRMHDKLFIVDDTMILGSSSLWEPSRSHIQELDAETYGVLTEEAARHFDEFWKYSKIAANQRGDAPETAPISGSHRYDNLTSHFDPNFVYEKTFSEVKNCTYVYDSPTNKKNTYESVRLMLQTARHEITVVTAYPYFSDELKEILKEKKANGLKVEVITTSFTTSGHEHISMKEAFRTQIPFFQNSKIDLYISDDFVHQKMIVVDNSKFFIGSFNFDVLGSFDNTENGLIFELDTGNASGQSLYTGIKLLIDRIKKTSNAFLRGQIDNDDPWACSSMLCSLWTVYYSKLSIEK
jgi:putative cardiolipin synthase